MYCADDSNIYLQGTRDTEIKGNDHAYLIYEVQRCNDDIRNTSLINEECNPNE